MSVPPPPTAKEAEERITARLARQQLLYRKRPAALSFILEQALIERHTGGEETTRALIDHLLDCAQLTNVELQVMPLVQPDHAGTDGPLQLLETQDNQWLGYSEGQQTGQLLSSRKDISDLQQRYARMRSQALSPADSVSLLTRLRGAL